jgi:hypothetical protein
MTSLNSFTSFSARLREFMPACLSPVTAAADEFPRLALALFELQFRHNTAYRTFCHARGVSPEKVERWNDIPAVPTSAFKELEFSCLLPGERTTVFHSSGTTEQRPGRHFHHGLSLEIYEASLLPWFCRHLLPGGEPKKSSSDCSLAILTPPFSQAPHSSLAYMFETIRRALDSDASAFLGAGARHGDWTLDWQRTIETLRRAVDAGEPLLLLGTAFLFVHLLDHLAETNLRFELPPGSRVLETGGYKGRSRHLAKSELYSLITARLGVPASLIVSEYGLSEHSSQAYDHAVGAVSRITHPASRSHPSCLPSPAARSFHFPPWARVQIISPETGREVAEGQSGLIRLFDLANVYSVMAVQTEDVGIRRGSGFELLGRAALAEPRGCSLMTG